MRRARKALAASFVVTFASSGCDEKPAAPAAAPTVDVGGSGPAAPATTNTTATATATATVAATGQAAPTATTPSAATATATAAASVAQALPPAPSTGHVARQPDGTCIWSADVICPRASNGRILPCNPPRPHLVQCPPGDAGP